MGEYWHWTCDNCGFEWKVPRGFIEKKAKSGEKIPLGCRNCGCVSGPKSGLKPVVDGPKTWLPCIVFTGPEAILSPGTPSSGLWKDAKGNTYTRDEYIETYFIDPKINRDWRLKGMPHVEKK